MWLHLAARDCVWRPINIISTKVIFFFSAFLFYLCSRSVYTCFEIAVIYFYFISVFSLWRMKIETTNESKRAINRMCNPKKNTNDRTPKNVLLQSPCLRCKAPWQRLKQCFPLDWLEQYTCFDCFLTISTHAECITQTIFWFSHHNISYLKKSLNKRNSR